ncbi:MAG: hypothetical protein F4Y41_10855 [Gammaproteobacteria bacterium]|nr:hypothetical protein [Gammaproteobacteria bacterium]MYF29894.1 hypothetical protein [Gammaproteobacteria bacterium]
MAPGRSLLIVVYDYLLVVGPGRSGSDFLYRILRAHPDYAFPDIKEGAYYRSVRAYERAQAKVAGGILCDIANDAYHDPKLTSGVQALQHQGVSILMMVLLRNHRDRALSAMRFRKSRGRPSALRGARHLEDAVVQDRLTPGMLEDIFGLRVDVLTVDFTTLVEDTASVLAKLASLCDTGPFDTVATDPVNASTQARFVWLSTLGWLSAVALRRLGLTRMLQRIKDSPAIGRVFFKPPAPGGQEIRLSETSASTLDDAHRECWSVVMRVSTKEHEGLFLRRESTSGQDPGPADTA